MDRILFGRSAAISYPPFDHPARSGDRRDGAIRSPDIYRFNAEIGYWLGEDYWGLGYTTQALREFSDWLFAHTDLNRLFAGVFSFNNASMRVLIKAGFHPEAIHARAIYKNNQFWDEHYFVKFRDQSSVS